MIGRCKRKAQQLHEVKRSQASFKELDYWITRISEISIRWFSLLYRKVANVLLIVRAQYERTIDRETCQLSVPVVVFANTNVFCPPINLVSCFYAWYPEIIKTLILHVTHKSCLFDFPHRDEDSLLVSFRPSDRRCLLNLLTMIEKKENMIRK